MLDLILPAQEYDLKMMSLIIFLPTVFALLLLVFPRKAIEWMRWCALFGTACTLVLSLCMLIDYHAMLDSRSDRGVRSLHHPETSLEARMDKAMYHAEQDVPRPRMDYDWVARVPWIERFDIGYTIGIDGISLPLVILTSLVMFLAVIASWNIEKHVRAYLFLLLLLQTGVLGAFMALDMFLFYVFYELMLLPMYFLVGLWGGGRRKYAAMKFVIYTLLGSIMILIAMIALYFTDARVVVDAKAVEARAAAVKAANPSVSADDARQYHTFDILTLQRLGQLAMLVRTGQHDRIAAREEPTTGRGSDPTIDPKSPDQKPDDKVRLLGRGVDPSKAQRGYEQPFFSQTVQYLLFLLLFIGFAVKVPLFPLHSWLPDAHVEAPTPISMILAGILLKLGGYGILRLAYPICPWAAEQLALFVGILGAFAIVYGALVAMGQSDFKKLLAYSSISHMGYVILGIAAWSTAANAQFWTWGVSGAMFQMISHGITASALFFVVGVLYDRAHHREINQFGGVMGSMPLYGGMAAILFFASMGLPTLCGFVGEVFVVLGTWSFQPWLAVVAILATVLTAGYLLWTWQRVYLGTNPVTAKYPDLSLREALCLLPFVLFAIALGVFPQTLLISWMEPSITQWVESLSRLKR